MAKDYTGDGYTPEGVGALPATIELDILKRHTGIAGQFCYSVNATADYGDGPETTPFTFMGSTYGGRVVVAWPGMPGGVFVAREVMDKCGPTLTPEWIKTYFAD